MRKMRVRQGSRRPEREGVTFPWLDFHARTVSNQTTTRPHGEPGPKARTSLVSHEREARGISGWSRRCLGGRRRNDTMAIQFSCPNCQGIIAATDSLAGKRGQCPYCRQTCVVPPLGTAAALGQTARPARFPRWIVGILVVLVVLSGVVIGVPQLVRRRGARARASVSSPALPASTPRSTPTGAIPRPSVVSVTLLQNQLCEAARQGAISPAKEALARGATPNRPDDQGQAPIHLAAAGGHAEFIRWLIEAGAAVDLKDGTSEYTALHHAASHGQLECVRVLLQAKADPNARARNAATPLHLAANAAIASELLAQGANLEAAQADGRRPLHAAATSGRPEVVQLLLAKGVEINPVDEGACTPLDLAEARSDPASAALLRQRGGTRARPLFALSGVWESPLHSRLEFQTEANRISGGSFAVGGTDGLEEGRILRGTVTGDHADFAWTTGRDQGSCTVTLEPGETLAMEWKGRDAATATTCRAQRLTLRAAELGGEWETDLHDWLVFQTAGDTITGGAFTYANDRRKLRGTIRDCSLSGAKLTYRWTYERNQGVNTVEKTGRGSFRLTQSGRATLALRQRVPTPQITSVSPKLGEPGKSFELRITGRNFEPGLTLDLGEGIEANVAQVVSDAITATVTIAARATPGFRGVQVRNPSRREALLRGGFRVVGAEPAPEVAAPVATTARELIWEGVWDSPALGRMTLHQHGGRVTGNWGDDRGTFEATVTAADGLRGAFKEGSSSGQLTFLMDPDRKGFKAVLEDGPSSVTTTRASKVTP